MKTEDDQEVFDNNYRDGVEVTVGVMIEDIVGLVSILRLFYSLTGSFKLNIPAYGNNDSTK